MRKDLMVVIGRVRAERANGKSQYTYWAIRVYQLVELYGGHRRWVCTGFFSPLFRSGEKCYEAAGTLAKEIGCKLSEHYTTPTMPQVYDSEEDLPLLSEDDPQYWKRTVKKPEKGDGGQKKDDPE